jgi:CheY-like chemotaxis protein
LSSTRWEGADLRKIVDEEMAPYHATHRQRVITDGPAAVLLPATAQAVALALHELATNAAKYGALSTEAGTLHVRWKIGDDALVLDWTETGGPPAAEPARLGFGLTIVRSSIEAQFRGGVSYEWRPDGLRCRLSIPATQIAVAPPPKAAPAEAPPDPGAARRSLAGMRLMVVEDELLVGMLLQDILTDLGAEVAGPYGRLVDGLAAAKAERFDAAILDLNLAGQAAEPLADLLMAHSVPFVFITGYQRDSIDRRYANVPVLPKPIDAAALEGVLLTLLGGESMMRAAEGA